MKAEGMQMSINVYALYDYGTSVTVQIGYFEDNEFILEECDHAGAIQEDLDYGGLYYDRVGDLDWQDDIRPTLVCDKPNCDWQEMIEPEEPEYDNE